MHNPTGTYTLFKRETKRFLKVWMQTILAPVISNLLFLMIFGLSISRSVDNIGGLSYLQFIVPGLVLMGIVNNAYQNPSSSMIIQKYQGLIQDLMIIPLKKIEIMLAVISSAVLRGLIVGVITLIPALFFVSFPYSSLPVLLGSAVLVSLFFSFLGLFVGIWAKDFDKTAFIQNFVLTPLVFLGGVFFPVSNLPGPFDTISLFNPIVHMANLLRYGFTGYVELPLLTSFVVLGSATLVLGLVTFALLRSGWRLQT